MGIAWLGNAAQEDRGGVRRAHRDARGTGSIEGRLAPGPPAPFLDIARRQPQADGGG